MLLRIQTKLSGRNGRPQVMSTYEIKTVPFNYMGARAVIKHHQTQGVGAVQSLYSEVRGEGHARNVMHQITDYADNEHIHLSLVVRSHSSSKNRPDALTNNQLVNFYKKFGFKVVSSVGSPIIMHRLYKP